MKKILFVLSLVAVYATSITCYAQKLNSTREKFVMPIFIDSTAFTREFSNDYEIKKVYQHLEIQHDYGFYSFTFNIARNGRIIPDIYEKNPLINKFFIKFKNYKWTAAHVKGCIKCKRIGYGIINLYLTPQNKTIRLTISVGDGAVRPKPDINTLYDKTIMIE